MRLLIGAGLAGAATAALVVAAVLLLAPVGSAPSSGGPARSSPSTALAASDRPNESVTGATPSATGAAPSASASSGVDLGQVAPDFSLLSLAGKPVRLSDFRGHPVWINFWASWCPPCRDEMPRLEGVYLSHEADGLVILGVAVRDAPADAGAFVKVVGVTYPIVLDEPGDIADVYRAVALPVQYWIDRDGIVRGWAFGELPLDQYDLSLATILPSPSPAP